MIPDRRDFFEASRDEKEPERDSRSGSHVTTDRTNSKFLPKRTEISLVQSSQTNFLYLLVAILTVIVFKKCLLMKERSGNFHEFHPHCEKWYARRSIIFPGDEFVLCDSLFGAELRISLILEIREDFLYELTTGASVPLGVAAENLAKSSKLGGKNSCQRCANSLTLTRIPLTIPKGR